MMTWRPLFHLWLWQLSYTEAKPHKNYVRVPAFSKVCLKIQNYSNLPFLKLASCQCATCFSYQLCVAHTLPTSHLSVNRFEPCQEAFYWLPISLSLPQDFQFYFEICFDGLCIVLPDSKAQAWITEESSWQRRHKNRCCAGWVPGGTTERGPL